MPKAYSVETFHPLLRSALLYVAPGVGMGLAYVSALHLLKFELRLYGALIGSFALAALVLLRQYVVLPSRPSARQSVPI